MNVSLKKDMFIIQIVVMLKLGKQKRKIQGKVKLFCIILHSNKSLK